jgi:hypothetical protein
LLCFILATATLAHPQGGGKSFTVFDVPGAGTGMLQGTIPLGINAAGDVTGFYVVAPNVAHGFMRASDGTMTAPIDAPDAGTGFGQGTFPISINAVGDIAGMYFDTNNVYHGFVRGANGTITEFDAPGAFLTAHLGTEPLSIDAGGMSRESSQAQATCATGLCGLPMAR